jgi:hypothetical protein
MFHRAHVTISAVCSVLTRKHCRSYGTESRAFIETLQSRLAAAPRHKMKAGPTSKRASVLGKLGHHHLIKIRFNILPNDNIAIM